MACRQSKIRDCRDTVDDRVSTTALIISSSSCIIDNVININVSPLWKSQRLTFSQKVYFSFQKHQFIFKKRQFIFGTGREMVLPTFCRNTQTNHEPKGVLPYSLYGSLWVLWLLMMHSSFNMYILDKSRNESSSSRKQLPSGQF